MKRTGLFAGLVLVMLALVAGVASAQAPAPAVPPAVGPTATAPGNGGTLAVVMVIGALLVLVGIGVKLYDLKRKREAEGVHLQAQVSDALLRDETLGGLAITPTARVPFWSGTPAVIELSGRVASPVARDRALQLAASEASRLRADVEIIDHLTVESMARVA
jgi:hypothetical protein